MDFSDKKAGVSIFEKQGFVCQIEMIHVPSASGFTLYRNDFQTFNIRACYALPYTLKK